MKSRRIIAKLLVVVILFVTCFSGISFDVSAAAGDRFGLADSITNTNVKQGGKVVVSTDSSKVEENVPVDSAKDIELEIEYNISDSQEDAFKATHDEGYYRLEYELGDIFVPKNDKMEGDVYGDFGVCGDFKIVKINGKYVAQINILESEVNNKEHFGGKLSLSGRLDDDKLGIGTESVDYSINASKNLTIPVKVKDTYDGFVNTYKSMEGYKLVGDKVVVTYKVTTNVVKDTPYIKYTDIPSKELSNPVITSANGTITSTADGFNIMPIGNDFKAGDKIETR